MVGREFWGGVQKKSLRNHLKQCLGPNSPAPAPVPQSALDAMNRPVPTVDDWEAENGAQMPEGDYVPGRNNIETDPAWGQPRMVQGSNRPDRRGAYGIYCRLIGFAALCSSKFRARTMISTPNINRYDDVRLGNLVIMLALEGLWSKALPLAQLRLAEPAPLIALCRKATEAAPAASYDADEFEDWVRWPHLVGQAFRAMDLSTLQQSDRDAFYDWLENGMTSGIHDFPHRMFWYDACVWAWRRDDVTSHFDGGELDIVRSFATDVAQTIRGDDYKDAIEGVCQNRDTYGDTFLKTKFHINLLPDVMIRPQLVDIGYMRRAHIIRTKTQTFLKEGGNVGLLERMVRLYAETLRGYKYIEKYIDDQASFAIDYLWSDRFVQAKT